MNYRLIITKQVEKMFDHLIHYLIYRIKNRQAAMHLFDNMESLHLRLEENPFRFPACGDTFVKRIGRKTHECRG